MTYMTEKTGVGITYKANAGPLPKEGSVPYPTPTLTASAMDLLPRRLKPGQEPFSWPLQKVVTSAESIVTTEESKHVKSLKLILAQAEADWKDLEVYNERPGMNMALNRVGMLINTIKKELTKAT